MLDVGRAGRTGLTVMLAPLMLKAPVGMVTATAPKGDMGDSLSPQWEMNLVTWLESFSTTVTRIGGTLSLAYSGSVVTI